MSIPHEGSRDVGDGIIVCVTPDVCKTPVGSSMVPIPYSITAKQGDDANTVATVRMTKKRAHNMGSLVTKCTGDAPGTGTGIKSGTVGSVCHPKTHSSSVRIRGEWAIRDADMWEMNNRNTVGKLTYVKSKETFEETPAVLLSQNPLTEAPQEPEISPALAAILGGMNRAQTEGLPTGSYQVAQSAGPLPAPTTTPAPGIPANSPGAPNRVPRPPAQIIQFPQRPPPRPIVPSPTAQLPLWARALRFAGSAAMLLSLSGDTPEFQRLFPYTNREEYLLAIEAYSMLKENPYSDEWAADVQQWYNDSVAAARAQQAQEEEETRAEAEVQTGNVRIEEEEEQPDPCNVQRYGSISCKAGEQAHHIVPDSLLRYGNRADGEAGLNRIPGMPSFRDGMAICLTGQASDPTSGHGIAHSVTDPMIAAAGATSAIPGTTTLGIGTAAGIAGASAAKPDCTAQITAAATAQFGPLGPGRLVNAANRPARGAAREALIQGL